MKKKHEKLSLEKFNIARLTKNMHSIYGGGTNGCATDPDDTRNPEPPTDSSLECDSSLSTCQDGAITENPGN